MEKTIDEVTFKFIDGTVKVLRGKELLKWKVICLGMSDYLLPGDATHVLGIGYHGLARGFVPPETFSKTGHWKADE